MPIKFAVKIVGLKVSMSIANPMTVTYGEGHLRNADLNGSDSRI